MLTTGNHFLTGLMALGMAWAFMRADGDSATTRALALALMMSGVSIFARIATTVLGAADAIPPWTGGLSLPGALAFAAAFEWTRRVRATIPAGDLRTGFGDTILRIAQVLALVYAMNAICYPWMWVQDFLPGLQGHVSWSNTVYTRFVAPLAVAMLLWTMSMLLCLKRRPDPAERVRLIAVLIACPMLAAGLVLPLSLTPTATTLGLVILLAGALRHAELRGRRGLFLGRFLSPQVAELVNRDGLQAAMHEDCYPISIVSCDLRGFTAFAAHHDSSEVLALLRDYYDVVGAAAAGVEGTIKDYAGDGVLILVGAPVQRPDHAPRAIELAGRIRTDVGRLLAERASSEHALGIGVGVASGAVTTGVIGGEGRLEYAAVGSAVNLAARLCDHARDGEILIDDATLAASTERGERLSVLDREPLTCKGFVEPVRHYALGALQPGFA